MWEAFWSQVTKDDNRVAKNEVMLYLRGIGFPLAKCI